MHVNHAEPVCGQLSANHASRLSLLSMRQIPRRQLGNFGGIGKVKISARRAGRAAGGDK